MSGVATDFEQDTRTGFGEEQSQALEPLWLTRAEVEALHEKQLARFGGPAGIRDVGALESALGRPVNRWHYEGCGLIDLAASYAFGLARNHPFVDGNKRAAFVSMVLFLRKNGVRFAPPPAEATVAILMLAAGEMAEEGLARWICDRMPAA